MACGQVMSPSLRSAAGMTGDSTRVAGLRQARSHLHHANPVLARLTDDRPDFDPRAWMAQLPPMDLYGALLFQVVGQQLSVAATRRILALFGGHLPSPAELLAEDPGKLREAGLSWRKISTLRDLAGRLSDGRLNPDALGAARQRAHGGTHRDFRDRSLDRAGRPHHRAPARR